MATPKKPARNLSNASAASAQCVEINPNRETRLLEVVKKLKVSLQHVSNGTTVYAEAYNNAGIIAVLATYDLRMYYINIREEEVPVGTY